MCFLTTLTSIDAPKAKEKLQWLPGNFSCIWISTISAIWSGKVLSRSNICRCQYVKVFLHALASVCWRQFILHFMNVTEWKCHIYKNKILLRRDNKVCVQSWSVFPTDNGQIKKYEQISAAQQGQMVQLRYALWYN